MAKLTEAANLQIVSDNLLVRLWPKENRFLSDNTRKLAVTIPFCTTSIRSNKLALYFEQRSFDKRYLKKSYLKQSYLKKSYLKKSNSLQSPSLQRIFRWMSVKGDHI